MRKFFQSVTFLLVTALFTVVLFSCNSGGDKQAGTVPPPAIDDSIIEFTGKLDTLLLRRTQFDSASLKQVAMVFLFEASGSPNLHGWSLKANGKDFDTTGGPVWKLTRHKPSNISYDQSTYFGNVVLLKKQMQKIKDSLKADHQWIVFCPVIDQNNHIGYRVLLGKTLPVSAEHRTGDAIMSYEDPGVEANPSPPKGYSE